MVKEGGWLKRGEVVVEKGGGGWLNGGWLKGGEWFKRGGLKGGGELKGEGG